MMKKIKGTTLSAVFLVIVIVIVLVLVVIVLVLVVLHILNHDLILFLVLQHLKHYHTSTKTHKSNPEFHEGGEATDLMRVLEGLFGGRDLLDELLLNERRRHLGLGLKIKASGE